MPIIRLLPESANKTWRALIETREPVHRIPPAEDNRYVISHYQLERLRQLRLRYELIEETEIKDTKGNSYDSTRPEI